ncbi:glycolate oxidase [Acaromyces ingoldii]|uniref:Glycolate oxidase n=1 Tax=Acaromyces ingoldii TaxID=215250 RepID=A0A316YVA9_9BASI|nr:glycolate oxidase [Acaromyces ingoldii]PWN92578.1 glycolate oxidase [Acaromyces ingoldii]
MSFQGPIKISPRLQEQAERAREINEANKTVEPISGPRSVALPPDYTEERFYAAAATLRKLIGNENVDIVDQPLNDGWYLQHPKTHDAFQVLDQDDFVASCVARPRHTEDVQAIVRWANEYLIPLWPISIGRNLGYGGAGPRVRGSVVIDMGHHMNRILEVNEREASCLVEPGVTYYNLYDCLQAQGSSLWIDTPDLPGGSVMGNALDRGVGYTPYGDHWGKHCGLEVVLPDGSLMRTGMGAVDGANTWQSFQHGFGPSVDGLFSQANNGIVTKMGMWLMPSPKSMQAYQISFKREEDLGAVCEALRPLMVRGVLGNVPSLRHVLQEAALHGNQRTYYKGPGPIDEETTEKIAERFGGYWFLYGCLYSDEDSCDHLVDVVRDAFTHIPGSAFYKSDDTPEDSYIRTRIQIFSGQPNLRELGWVNWVPDGAHLFFAPISPITAKDAEKQFKMVKERHRQYGFDCFSTFCVGPREMHHICCIIYNKADPKHKWGAYRMLRDMIRDAGKEGYGEYRTHISCFDEVMKVYGWNNNAFLKFNETIKDALDPNSIIAPGKSGIWGRRFRGKGWELWGDETRSVPAERDGSLSRRINIEERL